MGPVAQPNPKIKPQKKGGGGPPGAPFKLKKKKGEI